MKVTLTENNYPRNFFRGRVNSAYTEISQLKSPLHIHEDVSEIFLINEGSIFCNFQTGNSFTAEAGDIVFINGKIPHETVATMGTKFNFLFIDITTLVRKFHPQLLSEECITYREDFAVFRKGSIENTLLMPFLKSFPEETSPGYNESAIGQGYLIIAAMRNAGFLMFTDSLSQNTFDAMKPVFEYLYKNFRENISVSELAAKIGYNADYFSRLFRKATGRTVIDYINGLRLSEARYLLLNTEKTVTEIALSAGFSSSAHFFKHFSRRYTISPRKYRSLFREDQKQIRS